MGGSVGAGDLFLREFAQVKALTEKIVPEWFRARPLPFRIWCAACATGEEPYSIAMALAEAGHGAFPIEILASDACPQALEKARTAIYRERSFRALPPGLRQKYFDNTAGGAKLSPEMASRVQFRRVNLLDPAEIAPIARAHAIFLPECIHLFLAAFDPPGGGDVRDEDAAGGAFVCRGGGIAAADDGGFRAAGNCRGAGICAHLKP